MEIVGPIPAAVLVHILYYNGGQVVTQQAQSSTLVYI
jgi:hypothetical protein